MRVCLHGRVCTSQDLDAVNPHHEDTQWAPGTVQFTDNLLGFFPTFIPGGHLLLV